MLCNLAVKLEMIVPLYTMYECADQAWQNIKPSRVLLKVHKRPRQTKGCFATRTQGCKVLEF